ncbi:tetratricopeptide repeat protein [Sphingomonas rosea]|uniref:Tetratricopeptide repeat protein n=1 Tax=Sphingomonas rosea TaxID=335605 RepID=A0ABP7UAB8_9SPHN
MGRTIRTCSLGLALALLALPAAAAPRLDFARSNAGTFVAARAAADAGDARRAAVLYASLAAADPTDRVSAGRALAQAILAGDMSLALRLAASQPAPSLGVDARLLLVADGLRTGKGAAAIGPGWPEELGFITPFVRAWSESDRGRWKEAIAILDAVPRDQSLVQFVPEHKALILLAAGKPVLAQPLFADALRAAGGRGDRLRMAVAAGLLRSGDRAGADSLLAGRDVTLAAGRRLLSAERKPALPIATAAQGYAELLAGLAVTLGNSDRRSLPLAIVQIGRHADPANDELRLLAGLYLDGAERPDDALAVLRGVGDRSPFQSEARDAEIRTLSRAGRTEEALARAQVFVTEPGATADDWSRLGDVNDDAKRHAAAAEAYARALALVEQGGPGPERWSLHLLRGSSLEQADRWAEAEKALEAAYALAPESPVVLNYLGYARLERGERLDEAERLIALASAKAPEDASITDSLGWAQYKRGRLPQAISTLQRAAAADPAQAEINEHLGDALYAAGRKFEARFAWNAALVTAEDEVKTRVEAKIAAGLTPATAAP